MQSLVEKSTMHVSVDADELRVLPGGSDRKFYRIGKTDTLIIMVAPTEREVEEYIQIQEHLLHHGIAVPEIYAVDMEGRMVLMEDVGTESLCEIVRSMSDSEAVEELYGSVLRMLIRLQISGTDDIKECTPVFERVFDYGVLRWESDYFQSEFLEGFCGCPPKETEKLEEDFEKLATLLAAEPRYFMHRDFQSTNIFRKEGRIRIIDFQSAHRGMLSYDLAALLRDAYVELSPQRRNALFHRYYALLREHTDVYGNEEAFRRVYALTAIQRNMQALGAFSFLSMTKGRGWFAKAIPRGFALLREGLEEAGGFGRIQKIVQSMRVSECVQSMSS